MNNNPIILKIKDAIIGTEFENKVYIAGGFIRDNLMNRNHTDIDIVVNLPNGGIQLAGYLYVALNTNKPIIYSKFGTAEMVIDNTHVGLVMTRKETYNFKDRMPIVEFGTIYDDINRRDFTINSILYNITTGKLIDNAGGMRDIKRKIIRTIGDPNVIFAEDPLRILRAIRFAAQLGFKIDNNTWKYLIKYVKNLDIVSNERIKEEFNKILVSDYVRDGLIMLVNSGVLEYIIPQFKDVYEITNQGKYHTKNLINHTIDVVVKSKPTIEHRLAALLHDIGKIKTMKIDGENITFHGHQYVSRQIANGFMRKYRYTNDQINMVTSAINIHMNFLADLSDHAIRRYVTNMGKDNFMFAIDLAEADSFNKYRIEIINHIRVFVANDEYIVKVEKQNLPVDGNDIMRRFNLKPGKIVGELIGIEKEYILGNPDATIDEIYDYLKLHANAHN